VDDARPELRDSGVEERERWARWGLRGLDLKKAAILRRVIAMVGPACEANKRDKKLIRTNMAIYLRHVSRRENSKLASMETIRPS